MAAWRQKVSLFVFKTISLVRYARSCDIFQRTLEEKFLNLCAATWYTLYFTFAAYFTEFQSKKLCILELDVFVINCLLTMEIQLFSNTSLFSVFPLSTWLSQLEWSLVNVSNRWKIQKNCGYKPSVSFRRDMKKNNPVICMLISWTGF